MSILLSPPRLFSVLFCTAALMHPLPAEGPAADEKTPPPPRLQTREEMLGEVEAAWRLPPRVQPPEETAAPAPENSLRERLAAIRIPRVAFEEVPLSQVVETLSLLSEEYGENGRGVNIVLIDPEGLDPAVTLTVRRLPLGRILDFVTESVGFEYDVQEDAVVLRTGAGTGARLQTAFFPLSRSTLIRLTGLTDDGGGHEASGGYDPFGGVAAPEFAGPSPREAEAALRDFLQRAGIPFDEVPGSGLALADGQLVVTQSPRYLERIGTLLRRYNAVKQVEIEARFLEVAQGALEELGFNWNVQSEGGSVQVGTIGLPGGGDATLRSTAQAFGRRAAGSTGTITTPTSGDTVTQTDRVFDAAGREVSTTTTTTSGSGQSTVAFNNPPPNLPADINLGEGAGNFADITGTINGTTVSAVIRALSQQQGTDLLSAPRVTVLSGKTAEIVVAQELRYPRSYTDLDSRVSGSDFSGGSAVSITAGSPQDFDTRNVGVEMRVTPTVEDDGSISLVLEPQVTEFDGFVEYGGPSVAVSGETTVNVPSGFYQPLFSVRRIQTEVTIWDGATVVMGGLTREEVRQYEDKVPFLGDIPLLGRLFRSEGESSQKRNLLIFVTARLMSPGGTPAAEEE